MASERGWAWLPLLALSGAGLSTRGALVRGARLGRAHGRLSRASPVRAAQEGGRRTGSVPSGEAALEAAGVSGALRAPSLGSGGDQEALPVGLPGRL